MNLKRAAGVKNRVKPRWVVEIPEQQVTMPKWSSASKTLLIQTMDSPGPGSSGGSYQHRLELTLGDIATILYRLGQDTLDDGGRELFNLMHQNESTDWPDLLFRLYAISLGHEMYDLKHVLEAKVAKKKPADS